MLSNHYPVTYANAQVIPALVTWSSSPARWCAISTICGTPTTTRRRGGRGSWRRSRSGRRFGSAWPLRPACATLGLGPSAPVQTASADDPRRRQTSSTSSRRAARCAIRRSPPLKAIGEAPKGVLLDTPEHIAASRPAIRKQAVMTPRHAAQQHHRDDAGGARRRSPIGCRRQSRAKLKGPRDEWAPRVPAAKLADGVLDEFAAIQRRRRPPDAPLSRRAPIGRPRANISPGVARSALPPRSTLPATSGRVTKASGRARPR